MLVRPLLPRGGFEDVDRKPLTTEDLYLYFAILGNFLGWTRQDVLNADIHQVVGIARWIDGNCKNRTDSLG